MTDYFCRLNSVLGIIAISLELDCYAFFFFNPASFSPFIGLFLFRAYDFLLNMRWG